MSGHTPGPWNAEVKNQYGRTLGFAWNYATREDAIRAAQISADLELRSANPNWKWRKARVIAKAEGKS